MPFLPARTFIDRILASLDTSPEKVMILLPPQVNGIRKIPFIDHVRKSRRLVAKCLSIDERVVMNR
jgi:hypothetical protein